METEGGAVVADDKGDTAARCLGLGGRRSSRWYVGWRGQIDEEEEDVDRQSQMGSVVREEESEMEERWGRKREAGSGGRFFLLVERREGRWVLVV